MKPLHARIARISLNASARQGFALSGGYAVAAHGMSSRISEDVDIFTSEADPGAFLTGVDAMISALQQAGLRVQVAQRNADTSSGFVRLIVSDETESSKVEYAARDFRTQAPVLMDIGPVLHPDDAVGSKMAALLDRYYPRDFLDVFGARKAGYTRSRLTELAAVRMRDSSVIPYMLSDALHALPGHSDRIFTDEYDIPPAAVKEMRAEFAAWLQELDRP